MPPYRHKQRLKQYIAQHGEPDPLTRHHLLTGHAVGEPLKALEPYVKPWEDCTAWMQENGISLEEFDHDLSIRSALESALVLANTEQRAPYMNRIEKADAIFRSLTTEYQSSRSTNLPESYWWCRRIPK